MGTCFPTRPPTCAKCSARSENTLSQLALGAVPCFPDGSSGKEPTCHCKRHRGTSSIPGLGRSPGRGHGNPIQYSCLRIPMVRGAWQATVHIVTKSQTQQRFSMYAIFCRWQWYLACTDGETKDQRRGVIYPKLYK